MTLLRFLLSVYRYSTQTTTTRIPKVVEIGRSSTESMSEGGGRMSRVGDWIAMQVLGRDSNLRGLSVAE
jgi:hypothetical protein